MNLRRQRWQGRRLRRWCKKHYNVCLVIRVLAILIMLILVGIGIYKIFSKDAIVQEVTTGKESPKVKKEVVEDNKGEKTENRKKQSYQLTGLQNQKKTKTITIRSEILIAEHSIDNPASDQDRNTNMRIAAEKISGTVVQPGEKFSWLEIIGNPTIEEGYKEAAERRAGESVRGIGGGICQVSSTINSAIQKTEQRTDENYLQALRHSGEKPPKYLIEGRGDKEATVTFSGGKDFWFVNSLDYPVKIIITTQDDLVTVKIYKIMEEEIKVPNEGVE